MTCALRELALDLGDAALDEALALLRRVVVGVLRQVAVRARLGDRLDDRGPLDGLQPVQLGLEALGTFDGHRNLAHVSHERPVARRASGSHGVRQPG